MFKATKSRRELREHCDKLRRDGNKPYELAESLLQLASLLSTKKNTPSADEIVPICEETIDVLRSREPTPRALKGLLGAYRTLAEHFAEQGNRKKALETTEEFQRCARTSKSPSEIQLSLHVSAWILEKLWVVSNDTKTDDLQEAYRYGQNAMSYLMDHYDDILKDKFPENNETPDYRKASLERLLAGLAGNLGKRQEAEKYFRDALAYAKRKNCSDLKYELQIVQLDFPWVDRRRLAQILVNEAPRKMKSYAMLELSQVLIQQGEMEKANRVLLDLFARHRQELPPEDQEILDKRLVFVYKFLEKLKKIQQPSTSKKKKRRLYEKIADRIFEFSPTNKDTLNTAKRYYTEMLFYSTTDSERVPALVSLGETCHDLKQYREALKNYQECLELEKNMKKPPKKILATRMIIFKIQCKDRGVSKAALEAELNQLLAEVPSGKQQTKRELYKSMSHWLSMNEDPQASIYSEKAKAFKGEDDSDDENGMEESSQSSGSEDDESDQQILKKCERKAKQANDDKHIDAHREWRNNVGETELHLEAKGDNTDRLIRLLQHHYDVNAQDHSGWTPLHEAINHKKLDNVKILLKHGARVELASHDANGGGSLDKIGGKITPLMDACTNLSEGEDMLRIAELLFKANPASVTVVNEDGWNAVDFVLTDDYESEDYIPQVKNLLKAMQEQLAKRGCPVRKSPPGMPKSAKTAKRSGTPPKRLSRRVEGVTEYQKAMLNIGGRANRGAVRVEMEEEEGYSIDAPTRDELVFEVDDFEMELENIRPTSPVRHAATQKRDEPRESKSLTQTARRRSVDDFLEDDLVAQQSAMARKRKSRETTSQLPKRKTEYRAAAGLDVIPAEDDFLVDDLSLSHCESPASARPRRSGSVHILDSTAISTPVSTPRTSKLSIIVSFTDSAGGQVRNNLILAVDSTSTVKAVHEKCEKSLAEHQKSFSVCLDDGTEVDLDMPLSLLKNSDSEAIKFKCIVSRATAPALFQSYKQEHSLETEVVQKLKDFSSSTPQLDFSNVEIDSCIQPLVRSVVESSNVVQQLNLGMADLRNMDIPSLCRVLIECREFHAFSCNITDGMIEHLVKSGTSFPKLSSLDISFNPISSSGLSSFLSLAPSLTLLTAKGLSLTDDLCSFAYALGARPNISHLYLSNSRLTSASLEQILSSCNQVTVLDLSHVELKIPFSACWLPALRELKLVGSVIRSWETFIDWISLGGVEKLDLSCTAVTPDHILSLCDRRVESSNLVVRLLRCTRIEHGMEALKGDILRFLETRPCPLRLELPVEIARIIRLETALAAQFLIE